MTDTIFKPGEYVTRDGRRFYLLSTDGRGEFPLVGQIETAEGRLILAERRRDGTAQYEPRFDLMPPKQVRYVNVYEGANAAAHITRRLADECASPFRIACIRIEFTGGQYDD